MSPAAITVENLSKVYRIGVKEHAPDTLASTVTGFVRAPLRNLQRLRNLSRFKANEDSADTLWALKDVSFEVPEGEVLGVIGRNGAGKSTLLKILSRITEPTSGRAVIRGRVSSLLEVGTGFHPELTGRDNIYMNGTILGMTKREIDSKFDEIVDFSGVERFLDTPIKRYSSGMNVRLAFSVAAHLEPEILIIDEVLAVGDAAFQRKCLGKMQDVAHCGRTVLFVSHNMPAVKHLCRVGAVLVAGSLEFYGDIDGAIDEYETLCMSSLHSARINADSPVKRIRIGGDHDKNKDVVKLASQLLFAIDFEFDEQVIAPTIGIGIDSALGQRVLSLHTPKNSQFPPYLVGRQTIEVRVPDCPLAPGDYVARIVVSSRNGEVAAVNDAVRFSIANDMEFENGRGFHRGVCVARSEWRVVPDSIDQTVNPCDDRQNAQCGACST